MKFNKNRSSRVEMIHDKRYYSNTSKADRRRGVSYENTRLHTIQNLIFNNHAVRSEAERICNLFYYGKITSYDEVKNFIDNCNKLTKINLDYRNDSFYDSLVEQVYEYLRQIALRKKPH